MTEHSTRLGLDVASRSLSARQKAADSPERESARDVLRKVEELENGPTCDLCLNTGMVRQGVNGSQRMTTKCPECGREPMKARLRRGK